MIDRVVVLTLEAAAGGTTIDVGTIQTDYTTVVDANGVAAAFATASMNDVGEHYEMVLGTTFAGAQVGKVTTAASLLTVTPAGTYTAGKISIQLQCRREDADDILLD